MIMFLNEIILEALSTHYTNSLYYKIVTKIFNALKRKVLRETTKKTRIYLMDQLLGYSSYDDENFFVDWLFGVNPDLADIPPSIEQSWKIAEFVALRKSLYSSETAKAALEVCEKKDTTDMKMAYKLRLEAINADKAQRRELLRRYMKKDHNWSTTELKNSISGFMNGMLPLSVRRENYEYIFENLLSSLRVYSQSNAQIIFSYLVPKFDRPEYVLKRLRSIRAQIQDEEIFFKKIFDEKIEGLEAVVMDDVSGEKNGEKAESSYLEAESGREISERSQNQSQVNFVEEEVKLNFDESRHNRTRLGAASKKGKKGRSEVDTQEDNSPGCCPCIKCCLI